MNKTYAQIRLESSWWVDNHSPENVETFIAHTRGLGVKVAHLLGSSDSRTADSFLTGAQQNIARFNITTRAHKATRKTTFRFSEMKEGKKPVTIIIVGDPSRIKPRNRSSL